MEEVRRRLEHERSQIGALVRQVRHHVSEIDAALTRVRAGTYGACETCGRDIGTARLEALPAARTCIGCAARTCIRCAGRAPGLR